MGTADRTSILEIDILLFEVEHEKMQKDRIESEGVGECEHIDRCGTSDIRG